MLVFDIYARDSPRRHSRLQVLVRSKRDKRCKASSAALQSAAQADTAGCLAEAEVAEMERSCITR